MTRRALLRSWWRRIEVRPGLHHFIMAGAAIVMKRLLISHDGRFAAAFKFHGRNLGQQLRLSISARMTIGAGVDDCCRILFKQFSSQGRRAICRPNRFVWWML